MRMEDQALWLREAALQELVNPESIVAWAEERIMELDPPPLWLSDLATLRSSTLLDYASALGFSAGDSFSRPSAAQRASIAIAAMERGLVGIDHALSLVFRIWLPIHDEPETISSTIEDLLAEYDRFIPEPIESIPDNFESRCREAFREHLKLHPVPYTFPLTTASHISVC